MTLTKSVEIVTHCFRYASLLRYQLSSLIVHPPQDITVTCTVCFTHEDAETTELLHWIEQFRAPNVTWNWIAQEPSHVCHRSIGRNLAAVNSQSDWIWFCDADYWFNSECWKTFATFELGDSTLVFPRYINGHRDHKLGDRLIDAARKSTSLVLAPQRDFKRERMNRAIGGIQIVRGDTCRAMGYLKSSASAQSPRSDCIWRKTREDVVFRRSLRTSGQPVRLPGVYRIRHTQAGRNVPGLVL